MKALMVYLSTEGNAYFFNARHFNEIRAFPKLGLQYLAAVLEREGVETEVWDQSMRAFGGVDLERALASGDYLLAGFYCSFTMDGVVTDTVRRLRAAGIETPVVVGGPGTTQAAPFLDAGVDFVVRGEGDRTIVDILEHLRGGRALSELRGVTTRQGGRDITHAPQPLIPDLDSIPFPQRTREEVLGSYDYHLLSVRLPYVTMISSRGCPYRCGFCTSGNFWENRLRTRSPGNVVQEIDLCERLYGARFVSFKDDVFGFERRWLDEFCDLMIARGSRVKWSTIMHTSSLRHLEIAEKMARAGCTSIVLGVQSSSGSVLAGVARAPFDEGELIRQVEHVKRQGILVKLQFIVGLPGDDLETHRRNLRLALAARPHYASFYPLLYLDGSDLWERASEEERRKGPDQASRSLWWKAHLRYYAEPRLWAQNLSYIARHNPGWVRALPRFGQYARNALSARLGS